MRKRVRLILTQRQAALVQAAIEADLDDEEMDLPGRMRTSLRAAGDSLMRERYRLWGATGDAAWVQGWDGSDR